MSEWIVYGTSMITEADTAEEAIERAEQSSGWNWEAVEQNVPGNELDISRTDAGRSPYMRYGLSAGEIIDALSRYPRDTPVLGYAADDYVNVEGIYCHPVDDPSIVITMANDFDSRQF